MGSASKWFLCTYSRIRIFIIFILLNSPFKLFSSKLVSEKTIWQSWNNTLFQYEVKIAKKTLLFKCRSGVGWARRQSNRRWVPLFSQENHHNNKKCEMSHCPLFPLFRQTKQQYQCEPILFSDSNDHQQPTNQPSMEKYHIDIDIDGADYLGFPSRLAV